MLREDLTAPPKQRLRLLRPSGVLVLEEPEISSWTVYPPSEPTQRLVDLILRSFTEAGGDFNAGRALPDLLGERGLQPAIRADVVALPPGHACLGLPQQFASSLGPRLLNITTEAELDGLVAASRQDTVESARWGLTFTLIQTWSRRRPD